MGLCATSLTCSYKRSTSYSPLSCARRLQGTQTSLCSFSHIELLGLRECCAGYRPAHSKEPKLSRILSGYLQWSRFSSCSESWYAGSLPGSLASGGHSQTWARPPCDCSERGTKCKTGDADFADRHSRAPQLSIWKLLEPLHVARSWKALL